MADLTYDDFKDRISIQDVLIDAGYTLNRRDGLRYPSYVRLDNEGKRIRGDKFIVTANGKCCFQPPTQKNYNIIGFIKEHPEMFREYTYGMDKDHLVNLVCNRLLNNPVEVRETKIINPARDIPPFNIKDYTIQRFEGENQESQKAFYPYFKPRGISLGTQYAFRKDFLLAEHTTQKGETYRNLSFPMTIPGKEGIVGFEERGKQKADGTSYKGMALGSNASEGVWIASPNQTPLKEAKHVIVFESAYDAMAFYQLLTGKISELSAEEKREIKDAVFVSTGGNPSVGQMKGIIRNAPSASFHLAFDNDQAGKQFVKNFQDVADSMKPLAPANVPTDMKTFIESFGKEIQSTKELTRIEDEQYFSLPEDLKELYRKYDSAREEAMEYHASPFLCKEDKQAASDTMSQRYKEFKTALLERLHIKEGQNLNGVKIIREEPSEGYKDFNDQILDKKIESVTDLIETVFDDDGNADLTTEEQDENEENRHHGHKR